MPRTNRLTSLFVSLFLLVGADLCPSALSAANTGSPAQLQIQKLSLPKGMVKAAYSSIFTATGGTKPYTFSLLSGSLPKGLALSSAGQISGIPEEAGTSSFTIALTDTSSQSGTITEVYSITIEPANAGTHVTKCGALASPDTLYVLENDVSASGTCFSVQASNISLNLNGHTITYNTGDQQYARYGIVGMHCWDPNLTDGQANGNPCGGTFANFTVFGGTITEGSGAAANYAHCIRLGQNMPQGPTVYEMTFNFHSDSAKAIHIEFESLASGLGPIIHDNIFNNGVKRIVNRDEEDGVTIGIIGCGQSPSLTSRVYDNTITGGPQSGIRNQCQGAEVDHNTISQGNPEGRQDNGVCSPTLGCQYTNDFGILAWQENGNVHDNLIQPSEGRGIQLTGKGTMVQNNAIIGANEINNNSEYDGCTSSGAYGIQWDDGVLNSTAQNNAVSVTAKVCIASALRLTDVPQTGNNRSIGNTYQAVRTPDSLGCLSPQAGNVSGCAFAVSFDMTPTTSGFTSTNDTFVGDSGIFWFDWLGANNVTFISPKFTKETTNPSDPWYFAVSTNGGAPVTNFHIRDAEFGPGVDPTNNNIARQGTVQQAVSFYIDWTYTVTVLDQLGNPVNGALVTSKNNLGTRECSANTNSNGVATCVLSQYRISNDNAANQVEKLSPTIISVSKSGCVTGNALESVSQTTNRTIHVSCSH